MSSDPEITYCGVCYLCKQFYVHTHIQTHAHTDDQLFVGLTSKHKSLQTFNSALLNTEETTAWSEPQTDDESHLKDHLGTSLSVNCSVVVEM